MGSQDFSIPSDELERYFREYGDPGGARYAQFATQFGEHWKSHLEASRRFLLAEASSPKVHESVVVLGASACRDVPVAGLARTYERVHLVDIDGVRLQECFEQVRGEKDGESLVSKIVLHTADVTGGRLANLILETTRLLQTETHAERAFVGAIEQIDAYNDNVPKDMVQELRSDCVISSGLTSQLLPTVQQAIRGILAQRFPGWRIPTEITSSALETLEAFRRKLIDQHVRTLAALAKPEGVVAWVDTVAECPFWGHIEAKHKTAVYQTLLNYLDSCPYAAVRELQLRQYAHHPGSLEDLLRLLSGVIRNGELSVKESQELIDAFRGLVGQVAPAAKAEVIPGGLTAHLGPHLAQRSPVQSWQWYLKPVELASLEVNAIWLEVGPRQEGLVAASPS